MEPLQVGGSQRPPEQIKVESQAGVKGEYLQPQQSDYLKQLENVKVAVSNYNKVPFGSYLKYKIMGLFTNEVHPLKQKRNEEINILYDKMPMEKKKEIFGLFSAFVTQYKIVGNKTVKITPQNATSEDMEPYVKLFLKKYEGVKRGNLGNLSSNIGSARMALSKNNPAFGKFMHYQSVVSGLEAMREAATIMSLEGNVQAGELVKRLDTEIAKIYKNDSFQDLLDYSQNKARYDLYPEKRMGWLEDLQSEMVRLKRDYLDSDKPVYKDANQGVKELLAKEKFVINLDLPAPESFH